MLGIAALIALVCATGPVLAHGQAAPERPMTRVAFVRAGDVYVSDASTGAELRLTDDGLNGDPVWTTGGQTLVFAKQRPDQPTETWRWEPNQGVTAIRAGLWSPNGTSVAFLQPLPGAEPSATAWVESGDQRTQITPSEVGIRWQPLAWSGDSHRLALARYELLPDGREAEDSATFTGATLWVTDTDDPLAGQLRQLRLPSDPTGQSGVPDVAQWSPDGQFLTVGVGPAQACVSCRVDGLPFWTLPLAGRPPVALDQALSEVVPGGLQSGSRSGAVAWSPQGAWLILSTAGATGRETYAGKQLVRFDPASGARVDLSHDLDWADIEPSVAPDGLRIAFVRGRAQAAQPSPTAPGPGSTPRELIADRRVWLMDADGGNQQRLTDAPGWADEAPVWTADGQWLVFVRWHADGDAGPATAEVWAVRGNGSAAQPLATGLQLPSRFNDGVGYYGAFGWPRLFAVAPAPLAGSASP